MKNLLIFVFLVFFFNSIAQTQIGDGNTRMQITYRFSAFGNYRTGWDSGYFDRKQNKLMARNAQILLKGYYKKNWEFDFGFDAAQVIARANDPQNPPLIDANLSYKGIPSTEIIIGYHKVPYSRNNFVSFFESAFWQRAEIVGGEFFGRRDVGITFHRTFLRKTINFYAGVYNGLGEASLTALNDPSGKPEYISRVDFSYPSRYRYKEIDERMSVVPMFTIGFNGRYTNKILPVGEGFAGLTTGEFRTKVISGEKYTYGADAAFQYKGFSAQFEIHQMRMQPNDSLSFLFNNYNKRIANGRVFSGGYLAQANYYNRNLKTIISARFEELNINDLVSGYMQRLGIAAAYCFSGVKNLIKVQYFYYPKEETLIDNINHKHQIRLGLQIII